MKNKLILYFLVLLQPLWAFAQIGGSKSFSILDVKTSARVAALGGDFLPFRDADLNIAINNPSLINQSIDNQISLNYVRQFNNNYSLASYSKTFDKIGSFAATFEFMGYGQMDSYDEYEQAQGKFNASEYLFILGWGRNLDSNFSIGANLKPIIAQYEDYNSFALAVDVAANYHNPKYMIDVTLLAKNIGGQITTFNSEQEALPFQLELGFSKKLGKAPFRLLVFARNLQKWDLKYEDPLYPSDEVDPFTGEKINEQSNFGNFADNLFRHTSFGIEFCPSKPFFIRVGYDYRTFKEGGGDSFSLTGLTYGFGFRVKQFSFAYARANYTNYGSPNYFTLTADLNYFFKGAAH